MKYIARFNQHSNRNQWINYGLVLNECPRCLNCKDWEHIILCQVINKLKLEFIEILHNKIEKTIYTEEDYQLLIKILSNIMEYFKQMSNFQIA